MLSRRFGLRLCQSCRTNLLTLFENGFVLSSTHVRRRHHHNTCTTRLLNTGKVTRAFSSSCSSLASESPASPADLPLSDGDGNVVAQLYGAQLEAIKQLPIMPKVGDIDESGVEYTKERLDAIAHHLWEAENAGTTPEAIKSDGEADAHQSEGIEAEAEAETSLQDDGEFQTVVRDPLEVLRDANASIEAVVREARHLHGEYLPESVLSDTESKAYKRLYGDPLQQVANKVTILDGKEARPQELLSQDGKLIRYDRRGREYDYGEAVSTPDSGKIHLDQKKSSTPWNTKSLEERAKEVAAQIGGELLPYEMEQEAAEEAVDKSHPLTVAGRFSTSPRTIYLPQESFVRPIQNVLAEYSNTHVQEMCERLFGGPGLPNSPLTPLSGRILPQTCIPLDASQHKMGVMEANAYISAIWPSTYAAATSVLVEVRKRLGSQWLRQLLAKDGGPSILDAGGGGVGVLAWKEIIRAEWETMQHDHAKPPPTPPGKATVLTGADNLRYRAASLLENTTFLPRLPDYVHVRDSATLGDDRPASQRKQFDVIIAPHTLWPTGEEWQRKQQVQNLWSLLNPDHGVLILIEKGVPRGFEVIAGARQVLLNQFIATPGSSTSESEPETSSDSGTVQKGKGMIIAPCTNHAPCPMYPIPGVSRGRKDYCSFQQRFIRPPFLQRILGARERNHDDVDFSYVAVQKGRTLQDTATSTELVSQGENATDSAFEGYEKGTGGTKTAQVNSLTLPRLVFPPLKRPGHITIDLCTPAGKIDRWIVTKSFSKAAYRDARKSSWGDLWALGAKTRIPRNLELGGEKSKRGQTRKQKLEKKAQGMVDQMIKDKREDREIEAEIERSVEEETKAMLKGVDDFDKDADDVLNQIQQEKAQRGRKESLQRERKGTQRELAKIASTQQDDNLLSRPRQGNHAVSTQKSSAHKPQFNASAEVEMEKEYEDEEEEQEKEREGEDNVLTHNLSSHLADFAAEARVDRLYAQSQARLSAKLRLRAGENKFKEPEKESWRLKMEKRKARGRTKKMMNKMVGERRAERRVNREEEAGAVPMRQVNGVVLRRVKTGRP
jgi:ribosomal protein RSM22 (predicted rRNA methylase)